VDEESALELIDRMTSDPLLRERFEKDPVATFEAFGVELTDQDRRMLRSAKGRAGEELMQRISKRGH